MGPEGSGCVSDLATIQGSRKAHIRNQDIDRCGCIEPLQGRCAAYGFESVEARVVHHLEDERPHTGLVVDNQDSSARSVRKRGSFWGDISIAPCPPSGGADTSRSSIHDHRGLDELC